MSIWEKIVVDLGLYSGVLIFYSGGNTVINFDSQDWVHEQTT